MVEVSNGGACDAKTSEAIPCSQTGDILPLDCFALVVRDIWGPKAPVAVQQYTGRPDRTCRAWSSDENDAPASAAFRLLRGKEGFLVLRRIMQGSTEEWWLNLQLLKECAEAYEARRKKG